MDRGEAQQLQKSPRSRPLILLLSLQRPLTRQKGERGRKKAAGRLIGMQKQVVESEIANVTRLGGIPRCRNA